MVSFSSYPFVSLCMFLLNTQAVHSSSSSSSSSYTSITKLDKYGSIPQIRHASKASDLYGSLTLVAVALNHNRNDNNQVDNDDDDEEAILVISLEKKISGQISSISSTIRNNNFHLKQQERKGKINVLYNHNHNNDNKDETQCLLLAMVGSGFKSDFTFLLQLVQRYTCNLWERYDILPNGYHIAYVISQVMLRFMGYDDLFARRHYTNLFMGTRQYTTDMNLFSSIPHINYNNGGGGEENEWITIGRPLGVKVFILELLISGSKTSSSSSSSHTSQAHIRIVEPSGVISPPLLAYALGKGNQEANKLLQERYKDDMSIQQVQDICIDIIKQLVLDENEYPKTDQSYTLVCEVLHKDGIDVQRIPIESLVSS